MESTRSTSTVGLPRESYTERAWILVIVMLSMLILSWLVRKFEVFVGIGGEE